ncbi:MAG: cupin domain-containing protein [Methanomicrobiales archaeon]|nr:cupin domain-containing protein [Methanomicrobiales archaeon]
MSLFEAFEEGKLFLPSGQNVELKSISWSPHAVFEGVELKHLITAKETGGAFSYHLVRIAPKKAIGAHIHEVQLETHEVIAGSGMCTVDEQKIPYEIGVISVLPAGVKHEVTAGSDGLYLFAKFLPALL